MELASSYPDLYFFNSESREKECFVSLVPGQVRMYTCGPTVYNLAHIGNFRTYLFEDLLRRTLKWFGYTVTQVVNLTDVDDKTIRGATQADQTLLEFTQPFKDAFFQDLTTLGIEKAEHYPAATDYIPQMIQLIQRLLDQGIAYRSNDKSIYYAIARCPRYGRLSHLKLSELEVGAGDARVASDEYEKENAADFVLWKAYDPERDGKVYWESPFGLGRPGWHIECSVMAISLLGETLDIHAGAVDNIFPHHENEIAQSESFTKKLFVRYWLHSEHLIVNQRKMSKSLGNFYTLRDLLNLGFTGLEVRYMLLHVHYRTQLNFTLEGLEGARQALRRFNDFIQRMQECVEGGQVHESTRVVSDAVRLLIQKASSDFYAALADDLQISSALAAVFDLMHNMNQLYSQDQLTRDDAAETLSLMQRFNQILGVFTFAQEALPSHLTELVRARETARQEKAWQRADQLRQQIEAAGYLLEDTPSGTRLKKALNR